MCIVYVRNRASSISSYILKREREREREKEKVCVCVCTYILCAFVCVCLCAEVDRRKEQLSSSGAVAEEGREGERSS